MSAADANAFTTRRSDAPPVRIVHLGLGAFHRSHQAWYTAHAADSQRWGIAAYSGRSGALAEALTAQDGQYTLIVRSPEGDRPERIGSIARAHGGSELERFLVDVSAPTTALLSLTITEAAYAQQETSVDVPVLRGLGPNSGLADVSPRTAIGRVVLALEARRRARSGPLALVSCDNLPDNGGALRAAVESLASVVPGLSDWISDNASFVSSSVDRITPRLSDDETAELARVYGDRAPVVTEPFSDWVIAGEFPAGRPQWEAAGVRFTTDLESWEARKLWLLNGAHSLLASLGRLRGHRTVSEAIADPECRRAVEAYWDEACAHLPRVSDVGAYRRALLDRFANARIQHLLAQIGLDADTKVRVRIVPVAERERRAGRTATGCAVAIAAWMLVERLDADRLSVERTIGALSGELAEDDSFVSTVLDALEYVDYLTLG